MSNNFAYFGNLSDADVVIQAGEFPNFKKIFVHSSILKENSPYFRVALSTTWAKKEDEKIILKKPNITYVVFYIILEYFYTKNLPLDQHDGSTILDLLIASDELLINELLVQIQDHLINVKTEWLKKNFSTVLHVAFKRETCKDLQNYCMDKICWDPKIIFDSKEFLNFEDYILVALLNQENLQIEEIELWDYLIKWGIVQLQQQKEYFKEEKETYINNTSDDNNINNNDNNDNNDNNNDTTITVNNNTTTNITISIDLLNWNNQDLQDLGNILKECIPLIRFSEFTKGEFYDKIWPLKDILPLELEQTITDFQNDPENFENFSLLPPRKPIISIDSALIKPQQASKIPDWIEVQTNSPNNSTRVRYEFKLLLRGSRDGFTPKVFHEKCDYKGPNVVVLKIRGSGQIIGGYNPIGWRSLKTKRWQYTKDSFLFSFGNRGNVDEAKLSRVTPGNEAIYDDPSFGPCFGKTDLDMRRQFNEENCSAKSRCYRHAITNTPKFAVDDYEVFQVLCHNVSIGNRSFCNLM
ncbi:hypothetical protein RhiirC2_785349 [Rhizophagus irregularis]|uniref:Serine-enriched protein n=1 Tax=Rhizophagus irregularis TaxID=588596 RepID=A0A2N1MWK6_9GLOM|nr:hypothetical protein RhiirC2_785349 [Rhizophagus irregularis]